MTIYYILYTTAGLLHLTIYYILFSVYLCMCMCVYVFMFVYVCVCVCVCRGAAPARLRPAAPNHALERPGVYVCMRARTNVRTYVHEYVPVYLFV